MMPPMGTVPGAPAPVPGQLAPRTVIVQGLQGQPIRVMGGQPQQPVRYVTRQLPVQNGDLKVASRTVVAAAPPSPTGHVVYKVASQQQGLKLGSQGLATGGDSPSLKVASQERIFVPQPVPSGAGQPTLQQRVVPSAMRLAPGQPAPVYASGTLSPAAKVTTVQAGGYTYRPTGSGVLRLPPTTVVGDRSPSSPSGASAALPPRTTSGLGEGALLAKAREMLQDDKRVELKALVVECFRAAESVKRDPSELNLRELFVFKSIFMQKTGLPESLFKDMAMDYCRFDFNGSGMLTINETYKLIKFYLYAVLRKAGVSQGMDVPMIASLDAVGYRNLQEVGKGAQGTVYFCKNAEGVEKCVKSYKKEMVSITGLAELRDEFEAMKLCACDRVAQAFEIFQDSQFYYMVGEAYHGGDFQTLKARAQGAGVCMDEAWWRGVFRQCFEGIQFMHMQAMMHCDIKEPNLMLRTNDFHSPQVVIIDLGLSKATVGKARTGGTPGYIPPETLERNIWFPKGDVFSMGVCVIQILTDKIPPTGPRTTATPGGIFVEGCRTVEDIANATRTRVPPFDRMPPEWPELRKWTTRLLQKNIAVRPTAQQALEDPWFTKEQRSRVGTGLTEWVNARNRFATDGITASVLVRIEDGDNE